MKKKDFDWKLMEIWFISVGTAFVAGAMILAAGNPLAIFISGIFLLVVGVTIRAIIK